MKVCRFTDENRLFLVKITLGLMVVLTWAFILFPATLATAEAPDLSTLIKELESPDQGVALNAARQLKRSGPEAKSAVPLWRK